MSQDYFFHFFIVRNADDLCKYKINYMYSITVKPVQIEPSSDKTFVRNRHSDRVHGLDRYNFIYR